MLVLLQNILLILFCQYRQKETKAEQKRRGTSREKMEHTHYFTFNIVYFMLKLQANQTFLLLTQQKIVLQLFKRCFVLTAALFGTQFNIVRFYSHLCRFLLSVSLSCFIRNCTKFIFILSTLNGIGKRRLALTTKHIQTRVNNNMKKNTKI